MQKVQQFSADVIKRKYIMQIILWEIGILAFLLWVLAVGFIVFSGILFYRQQLIFRHILKRLQHLEIMVGQPIVQPTAPISEQSQPIKTTQKTQETRLSIMKDEPISKYESMTLPDDVHISFVEKDQ
jgi:hypothetical protein